MPELTPQELNLEVLKLLGCKILPVDTNKWFWCFQCSVFTSVHWIHKKDFPSEEEAWRQLAWENQFARSLDACKPLIEEMRKAGWRVEFTLGCGTGDEVVEIYDDNAYERTHKVFRIANSKSQLEAAATALCRAYLKFKELTKEETK